MCRFLLHGLIVATWISRIPAIQIRLHLSNAALGLCLLGTAVGSMTGIPAAAALVSRFGSRRATSWSTVAFALALAALPFARNPLSLFLLLAVYGCCGGVNDVSMNAQGVAIEQASGAHTMSRFHAMFSIGAMAGASFGGLIAARDISPRLHLPLSAAVLILFALASQRLLLEAHDNVPRHSERLRLRHLPPVLYAVAAIGFCFLLTEGAVADWTGIYMLYSLKTNAGVAAQAYAVFSIGMAIFRLLGDSITTRLGPVMTLRAGALVAAAGLALALAARSITLALPGFAIAGAGCSVIIPLVFAAAGRISTAGTGTGIALVGGFSYVGFLIGPPVIGVLAQASSLRMALLILVALAIVAAALAPAVRPRGARP